MLNRLIKLGVFVLMIVTLYPSCKTKYMPGSGPDPYEHIQKLRDGTLIIFLQSYRNQLEQLKILAESDEVDETKKARAIWKYNELFQQRDSEMVSIMSSFDKNYYFSDFTFSYDFELKQINEGSTSITEVWDDKTLQAIELPDNVYFLRYNLVTKGHGKTSYEWTILTKDMETIPEPFPPVQKGNLFYDSVLLKISPDDYYRSINDLAYGFNYSLNKFYKKQGR